MKSVIADYRYRVICMRIVPVSGATVYLTDYVHDLTMSGHTYLSLSGYQFTGNSATSGFSPATIDIEGILDVAGITRAAIASGVYDGARCYVFATDWTSPTEDEEPLTAGVFGKAVLLDDRYQITGVSLIDTLNQTVGATYGTQCPKLFCGTEYAGCGVPLADNTVTGTLTSVTSASLFADSARTEADDVFGAGTIRFTSGANIGLSPIEIKWYANAGGAIQTFESFYYMPVIGDTYEMVRGCRKRLSDCKSRMGPAGLFNNVANFGGFLNIPLGRTYATFGGAG